METCMRHPEDWISPFHDANLRASTGPSGPPDRGGDRAAEPDGEEQRPFWVKAFDVASLGTLTFLLAVAAVRLLRVVGAGGPWWVLLLVSAAALLAADFLSGLVHWTCDRFFADDTPLIGRMLIHPFREHHRDPLAITRHGFFELCGNNALAVLLPLLAIVLTGPPGAALGSIAAHGFVTALALAIAATNQFHKWAHAAHRPSVVRWLQRRRLILSPDAHERHHRGDYSHGYCVTTGWLNPVLDAYRVLPRCEAWLRGLASSASPQPVRRSF